MRKKANDDFKKCKEFIMNDLLKAVEAPDNQNIDPLRPGDMVRVYLRIKEGNNERTQEFKGTVIRLRNGGNNANFTVRRVASNGVGVERTFLLRSPRIEKVVVERHSQVRRAQLYYLRSRTGKSARLKQKFS
jgi:large subunit ribosomal protein L19